MTDSILFWNQVSLDASKTDFSFDPAAQPMPEQGGPTRNSRALAIIHLAMYDAYAGVCSGTTYLQYDCTEKPRTSDVKVAQVAVATAATRTLIALFGRQTELFLKTHQTFVAQLNVSPADIEVGQLWGDRVASRMLANRAQDGSNAPNNGYVPSPAPGRHRPDPLNSSQGFLGPLWGQVQPFGIDALLEKVPGTPPPALGSKVYADDYCQVLDKGRNVGSTRTPAETTVGLFWAYDGARNIGVPPRLYNQVVRAISQQSGATEAQNAKLFAMVNVAMADAGIQCWNEKYTYNLWRPVLGIQEADAGWGPTGLGDGNPQTEGDPYWLPLGSPRTNQPNSPASTPSFPAYPSGHATFGTTALYLTQLFLGLPDNFEFEFVSDELDGVSVGEGGVVRPRYEAKLTIPQAIEDNILSRVYLGVHWQFDGREGERNGRAIAQLICSAFPRMA